MAITMKVKQTFIVRAMEAKLIIVIVMKIRAIFTGKVDDDTAQQWRLLLSCSNNLVTRLAGK